MKTEKNNASIFEVVLSNGKAIINMSESEYLETKEGQDDPFAEQYHNILIQYHKENPVSKTVDEMTLDEYLASDYGDLDPEGVNYDTIVKNIISQKKSMSSLAKKVAQNQDKVIFDKDFEEIYKEVSNNTKEVRQSKLRTAKEGFKCLGFKDTIDYVWSNSRQCLFALDSKDGTTNTYIKMVGLKYLESKYGKIGAKNQIIGIDLNKLTGEISEKCVEQGIFNLKNKFGFGIFLDPVDKDHLIINGEEIWGTNPDFTGERVYGKNIFANIKDLDFNTDIEPATIEESKEWLELLKTWNYKRGLQDALMVFGWSVTAPFAGCLDWSSHFSLTGEQGTGKSTQEKTLANFMGEFALEFDGQSSEAGIRQKVGSSSCVVLIDESESDSKKIANTLTFFRTASSGGIVAKGTSDQEGLDFKLKLSGMIAGIVPPALNPADMSRFLRIELLPKGEKIHPLLLDIERQNLIGKKMIMYIVQNFKMFKSVSLKVRKLLLSDHNNSRYADTFTNILAGTYMSLNHNDNDEGIVEFMKQFDFDKEKTAMESKDHDNLLNKLLKSSLRGEKGTYSIIEMINVATNNIDVSDEMKDRRKDFRRTLGRYGFKIDLVEDTYHLYISTKDDNFVKLLRNSKFDSGDIVSVLSRLSNAELLKDSVMIGGMRTQRSSVIKLSLNKNEYYFND